jgi:4-hydroxyphenylpyruvate dioxygenase
VFVSPYEPTETKVNGHIARHGDGVKDIAFTVENLEIIVKVNGV